MPATKRLLVAIATYNERESLPGLVDAIEQALPTADLFVIDDNSPDGTGKWCDERSQSDPRLRCLHRAGKLGLGSATLEAFRVAIDEGYDLVATLDADGSHDPKKLPDLVALTTYDDVAIGSRYCAGGTIEGWPLHRRVVSKIMNRATRLLLRTPIADASGAFRVYRVSALEKIDFSKINATGYAYLEEIVWRLHHSGATFAELPITFRDRVAGQSKANLAELVGKLTMLRRCAWRKPK